MTSPGAGASSLSWPPDDSRRKLANLRDLGGLRLIGGGFTRAGLLYRSDAPYPGDAVPDAVPVWPPATVIDLRSPGEVGRSGYRWPAEVSVHEVPLMREAAVIADLSESSPRLAPELPRSLDALYQQMLDTVGDRLASLAALAANSGDPVLVHCTAGKDRSGVAVAVLLLVGGVEPEDVVTDYTATARNMGALLSRLDGLGPRLPSDVDANSELLAAPEKAITVAVERLVSWPGGPSAWVEAHGASAGDVRRWRDRLAGEGGRQ